MADQPVRWREAMRRALYAPGTGFYTRGDRGPGDHFRTSVHASGGFAEAVARLLGAVDVELGWPDRVDLVDVGAGRGELLAAVLDAVPEDLAARLRPTGVDLAPRPAGLPARVAWADRPPPDVTGLLVANEWLDNVPLDVVEVDPDGMPRYLAVTPAGEQSLAGPVGAADRDWLARWWPLHGAPAGVRAEPGTPRDAAWTAALSGLRAGLAVAVDYGHLRGRRPPLGTLAGFRAGAEVPPVPDGTCDLTAHVAVDAVAEAGRAACGVPPLLLTQREALRRLGVSGVRPARDLATRDPLGYLRALAAATAAAELTDPAGLGGFWWVVQPTAGLTGLARRLFGAG